MNSKIFNKNYPCPICRNTHGCRVSPKNEDIVWCVRSGNDKYVPGYKFSHALSAGMGGAWISTDRVKSNYAPVEKLAPIDAEVSFKPISDSLLNKAYRQIIAERDLNLFHKKLLEQRGVDVEWLKSQGFVSLKRGTKTSAIHVPGVNKNRTIRRDGMFIPAFTPWGQIVGGQLATTDPNSKYVWLKGIGDARGKKLPVFSAYRIAATKNTSLLDIAKYGSVHLAVSEGLNTYTVSAKLFSENGGVVETASKVFKSISVKNNIDTNIPWLNAILLGSQMALGHGINSVTFKNVPDYVDLNLKVYAEWDGKASSQKYFTLKRIVDTVLKNLNYSFSGSSEPYSIDEYNETDLANGDKYFDTKTVWLVDGAAKAFYTASVHNTLVLGHPGANFLGTRFDFNHYLAAYGVEHIIHAPDAGDVNNISQIPKTNTDLHKALVKQGFKVSIAWWDQFTKESPDIDDLKDLSPVQFITPNQFFSKHPIPTQSHLLQIDLNTTKIQETFAPVSYPRQTSERKPMVFKEGERIACLASLTSTPDHDLPDYKFIHDSSTAGSGKSYDYAKLEPDALGVKSIIWVSNDPLAPEHNVPYYRGKDFARYRRASDGRILAAYAQSDIPTNSDIIHEGNCKRSEYIKLLTERNIEPTAEKTCKQCPYFKECQTTPGMYHADRKAVLQQPVFRCSPAALDPNMVVDVYGTPWKKSEVDEPGTAVILDDVTLQQFFKTFQISPKEIRETLRRLRHELPKVPVFVKALQNLADLAETRQYVKFQEILDTVGDIFERQEYRFINDFCGEAYHQLNTENAVITEDFYKLWLRDVYSVFLKFSKNYTQYLIESEYELPTKNPLTEVHVNIDDHKISITQPNKAMIDTICSSGVKVVIIGDATGNTEVYEKLFNAPVLLIKQQEPKQQADLEIIQFSDIGNCGKHKSQNQSDKVAAMKTAIAERFASHSIIDFKRNIASENSLNWFGTSRGSNAAADKDALLVIGTPYPNLSALEAQYSMLNGIAQPSSTEAVLTPYPINTHEDTTYARCLKESKDPAFAEFCYQSIHAEFVQGFARLRAVRRPGESLTILVLSTFPLQTTVNLTTTADFLGKSGEKKALEHFDIETAAQSIKASGKVLTQEALAEALGVSRRTISSYFGKPGRDWQSYKSGVEMSFKMLCTGKSAETLTYQSIQEMYVPYINNNTPLHKTCITDSAYVSDVLAYAKLSVGKSYKFLYQENVITGVLIDLSHEIASIRVQTVNAMDIARAFDIIEMPETLLKNSLIPDDTP